MFIFQVKGIGTERVISVLYKYSSFKKGYNDSFSVEINRITEKFVFKDTFFLLEK
jgi:hypothetical protein